MFDEKYRSAYMADIEKLRGLMAAAEVLLDRLKHKDYKKWVEVIMFSPPELVGCRSQGPDESHLRLGRHIKKLVEQGRATLTMGRDGVVCAAPTKKPSSS